MAEDGQRAAHLHKILSHTSRINKEECKRSGLRGGFAGIFRGKWRARVHALTRDFARVRVLRRLHLPQQIPTAYLPEQTPKMKRQRESDFDATCAPSGKRQAIHRVTDENALPAFIQHDENDATLDSRWGSNDLENPFIVSSSSTKQTRGLSKYGPRVRGDTSCATKINGIFRSTKTVTRKFTVLDKLAAC